ncbi:hypothetical protein ACHAXR_006407 [Thalassiosira sp. AJA248-18]
MEQAKMSAGRAYPKPRSNQRQSDDGDTAATVKSTDGGRSDESLSHHSMASCCSMGSSNGEVRNRYLNRLGIPTGPTYTDISRASQREQRTLAAGGSLKFQSCSAPEKKSCMRKPTHSSTSSSLSQGAIEESNSSGKTSGTIIGEDKIILLKRSVQFTTKLKSGPTDRLHQLTSKTSREDESSSSKFELSPSWTTFLSKDTLSASTTSVSCEPLDGAYDLFSLPSDSSAATSRCDSNRSLDITALDRLPSRDDLSVSSMPRRRKVSFDSTVKAATIPSRVSYSNRIRTRLWSSTENIYANAVRNEKEYAFDGNNWRTAREEDDFLRCSSTSSLSPEELVHPVHLSECMPTRSCWQDEQTSHRRSPSPSSRNAEKANTNQVVNTVDYSDGMFEMD